MAFRSRPQTDRKSNHGREGHLSLFAAMGWILSSAALISGFAYCAYFYYRDLQTAKGADSHYHIVAIVQRSQSQEILQSEYLAELLGLSIDSPTNLYAFDKKKAEQQLLNSPLIRTVSLHKVSPGTLFIDYSIRKPSAYLGDISNTAIDEEGVLLPFKPFFTPKMLPTLILGAAFFDAWAPGCYWGRSLHGEELALAKSIIHFFESERCGTVDTIDLKNWKNKSLGRREIVVTLKNHDKTLLRLSIHQLMKNLQEYKKLVRYSANSLPQVIDLRIDGLAIIQR